MRLLTRGAALAGALVLGLGVGAPAQAAPLVTLDKGHVDVVDVEYADGGFELHIHHETQGELDPAETLLRVLPKAKTTVPDDPAYAFLGAAGRPVWILPQVEDPDLLFAGLSTEELEAGVFAGDQVAVTLCGVSGPGKLSVFTTDAVGSPSVVFNSRDGLPDTTTLSAGTHKHVNWAFTAAGTYRVTFHVSARLSANNQVITSEPTTVTFKVLNS
ncbi:choice-of-anchor M domain-containing protein [Kibdelosporangium aridum]|nr:choice-of-anchor M domain-containing protein [Kibdelosporangium aridum]